MLILHDERRSAFVGLICGLHIEILGLQFPEMMNILGENYEEVRGSDAVLWRGDLFVFDETCGEDCKVYMLCISDDRKSFRLVNYVGYKAGARMATIIPNEASQSGVMNVQLPWLLDNWNEVIPIGSFETTKFFKWIGNQAI